MTEIDHERLGLRDGEYVARLMPLLRMVCKLWFRSDVRGIEHVPDGGVLMVSNHSGGLIAMDVPVIAVAFAEHFGDRPLYCLAHDLLFVGQANEPMRKAGFIPATREHAAEALRAGAATIVFPGGDHDAFRPTWERNRIDFAGRRGYVRTAIEAGVPIVPVVSIGGQEDQIHLSRGELHRQAVRPGEAAAHEVPPGHLRVPVRTDPRLPGQPAAAHEDLDPGARADRHRGGVRARPRRRGGRPRRAAADAGGARRAGGGAALPGPGVNA